MNIWANHRVTVGRVPSHVLVHTETHFVASTQPVVEDVRLLLLALCCSCR